MENAWLDTQKEEEDMYGYSKDGIAKMLDLPAEKERVKRTQSQSSSMPKARTPNSDIAVKANIPIRQAQFDPFLKLHTLNRASSSEEDPEASSPAENSAASSAPEQPIRIASSR